MKLSKTKKTILIIASSILLIIVIAVLIVNFYVGTFIEGKIMEALEKKETNYTVSIRKVGYNIILGNLKLYDLTIRPDSNFLERVKNGEAHISTAESADIPLFTIAGIKLYKAITEGYIELDKIEFSEAHITFFKGIKPPPELKQKGDEKAIKADSIYLKGITGVDLQRIVFNRCRIDIYDLEKQKYVLQSGEVDVELKDIDLIQKPGRTHVFELGFERFKLDMSIDKFELPGGWYFLHVEQIAFTMQDSSLRINNVRLWPQYDDLNKMASDLKFTSEMFNLEMESLIIYRFNTQHAVETGEVYADSILLSGLDIKILKDKRYPFDESRRPKLPHQLLKTMEFPLDIGQIKIENSNLKYQEKMPDEKELMTVTLNDLSVVVKNITSVADSIKNGEVLRISMYAKLMDQASLSAHFAMPLNSWSDTMYYSGSLGSSRFEPYNKAIVPALGIKFADGNLHSVVFSGTANGTYSQGKMTMKYNGLEGTVFKKDSKEKNKFMSWIANTAVLSNNPNDKGTLKVARMEFDRVMYKGFGNFMWKTMQSGIVNTVAPTGKSEKIDVSKTRDQKESRKDKKERKSKE